MENIIDSNDGKDNKTKKLDKIITNKNDIIS